jgi:hypothetical protein
MIVSIERIREAYSIMHKHTGDYSQACTAVAAWLGVAVESVREVVEAEEVAL